MEIAHVETSELAKAAAPYNPRKICDHDLAALRRSLKYFGTVEPIVVNRRSGNIVAAGEIDGSTAGRRPVSFARGLSMASRVSKSRLPMILRTGQIPTERE